MSNVRTATCHCGALSLACEGEPYFVAMCHCQACQRRTGSSYSLGVWYDQSAIQAAGAEEIHRRNGDDTGVEIRFHFCPACGTTVYWEAPEGDLPQMAGVAGGCFADADFPAPSLSVYGKRRHRWLTQPAGIPCFIESTTGAQESEA